VTQPALHRKPKRQFWRGWLWMVFVYAARVAAPAERLRAMSFVPWRTTGLRIVLVVVSVVLSLGATAVASPVETRRPDRHSEMPRDRSTKPTKLPPGAVTTYSIEFGPERILVGDGGVWGYDGTSVHRIALGAEPLDGETDAPLGTFVTGPVLANGKLWSVTTGPDECAPSSHPYALRENDLASGATVQTVVLPGWCRAQEDSRDVPPQFVVGGDAAWVSSPNPLSTSPFNRVQVVRVDTAKGTAAVTALNGPVGLRSAIAASLFR
jgi:hypothetical protein